jgi:hypothetical protein
MLVTLSIVLYFIGFAGLLKNFSVRIVDSSLADDKRYKFFVALSIAIWPIFFIAAVISLIVDIFRGK